MFLLLVTYTRPLADVDRHMPDHQAFLDRHYASGRFVLSGRREPRTGGAILAHGDDEPEVRALVAEDPFVVAGVAAYEIIALTITRTADGLRL